MGAEAAAGHECCDAQEAEACRQWLPVSVLKVSEHTQEGRCSCVHTAQY